MIRKVCTFVYLVLCAVGIAGGLFSMVEASEGVSLVDMKSLTDLGLGVALSLFLGYLLYSVLRDVRQMVAALMGVVDRNTAAMSAMTEIVRNCHSRNGRPPQ